MKNNYNKNMFSVVSVVFLVDLLWFRWLPGSVSLFLSLSVPLCLCVPYESSMRAIEPCESPTRAL